jgi:hypothetical protein
MSVKKPGIVHPICRLESGIADALPRVVTVIAIDRESERVCQIILSMN